MIFQFKKISENVFVIEFIVLVYYRQIGKSEGGKEVIYIQINVILFQKKKIISRRRRFTPKTLFYLLSNTLERRRMLQ